MAVKELPVILGFGDFTVHRRERSLRRRGIRLKLHGQPFEILLMLLDHQGEVVTREELQAKLWKGDTFVDFENGLNAAVKKLRRVLGDSAESPRYVETLPRVGYRFLTPVTAVELVEPEASPQVPRPEPPKESAVPLPAKRPAKFWRRVLAAAALVLIGLGVLLFRWAHPATAFSEADSVLVADFLNTTGDPVFDGTLKHAVTVKLGESPHFNLLNEPNLRAVLQLMERPAAESLVPPIDREVCQRAGAKVVIGGSIVSLGNQYVITLEARNCLTGDVVAHQENRATNRNLVIPALGTMIPKFRRTLGESLATIQKFDTPIEQATTPSLSALKAYAMGDERRLQDKEEESVGFYRMAIELDPNFAIAHARLGTIYRNLSQGELSRQYMQKAFDLRGHVSEKEKLYIAAHYYTDVTQEIDKAVGAYELWTQTYPRDWIPYNNLSDVAARSGLIDKAIPAAQQALRLNPDSWFAYGVLSNAYLKASRFAEAKAICERAFAEHHPGATIYNTLLRLAYVEDDQATVDRVLDAVKGKWNESLMLAFASASVSSLGKVRAAREFSRRSENIAAHKGLNEEASNTAYDESLFEAEVGNVAEARASVEQALRRNPEPASRGFAGLTLARIGDTNRAEKYVKEADVLPLDTLHNAVVLASARAAIQLDGNNPKQAIEELKGALPYDLCELSDGQTLYLRGSAYLQTGLAKDAEAQFQKLIDNHRSAITVYWALAHLGLARAYAQGGEKERSLEAYRNFLTLWKDADSDMPILRQARAEYQKLNASH
jgi:DNA-binding winged helix-turn-helix (wHTH) protein/tetratricopeptide (TPR) repeat protein